MAVSGIGTAYNILYDYQSRTQGTEQENKQQKTLQETENSQIFIGKQIAFDDSNFISRLYKIEQAALRNDREETLQLLKELVPDFHHEDANSFTAK